MMKKLCLMLIALLMGLTAAVAAAELTPGATVSFGTYEQDGKEANGREAIEWVVLKVDRNRALLLSTHILGAVTAYDNLQSVDRQVITDSYIWPNSLQRDWLNNDFLSVAFTDSEQRAIVSVTVRNGSDQSATGASAGSNTTDRLFLLSWAEYERYADLIPAATFTQTALEAADRASGFVDGNYRCNRYSAIPWALRSAGGEAWQVDCVGADGSLTVSDSRRVTLRPACWVTLDGLLSENPQYATAVSTAAAKAAATATPAPTADSASTGLRIRITGRGVLLRNSTDAEDKSGVTTSLGDTFPVMRVLEVDGETWYEITYDRRTYYMMGKYAELVE